MKDKMILRRDVELQNQRMGLKTDYKKDHSSRNQIKNTKMGGGMMQKPMGYSKGVSVKARGCKLGRTRPTKIT